MAKYWSDINLPGLVAAKKKQEQQTNTTAAPAKFVTGVEDNSPEDETIEPEVKIISAEWVEGPKGFQYNEQCFVDVKAEYLKKTVRARLRGKLFGIYDNQEIDLAHEVEGFIDDSTMIARIDIKKLFYISDPHYAAWKSDPSVPCQYFLKAINHTKGANELDSPMLEMPKNSNITVYFLEFPDILFNFDSAVPCLDSDNSLVNIMAAALIYAYKNPDKEAILYGHTDSSGDDTYNDKLSEDRAKNVKALLDNDRDTFVNISDDRSNVEDYQKILTSLTSAYGWSCDPGKIDNADGPKTQAALKNFQSHYNSVYKKSISVDGKIGIQTWGAIFDVTRDLIWTVASKAIGDTPPVINYGNDGNGVIGCGEQFAENAHAKQGRKSQKDRRVEIVFALPDELNDGPPYIGPIIMEPIDVGPITINPETVQLEFLGKW